VRGAIALALLVTFASSANGADAVSEERGEATVGTEVLVQPASPNWLLVVTPSVDAAVAATRWLRLDASWTADVVTGATPRTYGPPDVVSSATRFSEVRNVVGAGATFSRGPVAVAVGYAFGNENDYRSHLARAALTLDLNQHNTVVTLSYRHSHDSICALAQAPGATVLEQRPLDSSVGCFSGTPLLVDETLDVDSVEAGLTQTLTRRLVLAVVGSYQHLSGFQSNPYRQVRLSGGLAQPRESHPLVRDRGALTLRLRYAIESIAATLGADLRLYRDTWGVQSIALDATWEQPFRREHPAWRFAARVRGYVQSGADFYRDAGRDDSYDRAGPPGLYFTADQALAPLADLLLSFRATWRGTRTPDRRYARAFTALSGSILVEYLKIFALTPEPPNAGRTRGWASAIVLGLVGGGAF